MEMARLYHAPAGRRAQTGQRQAEACPEPGRIERNGSMLRRSALRKETATAIGVREELDEDRSNGNREEHPHHAPELSPDEERNDHEERIETHGLPHHHRHEEVRLALLDEEVRHRNGEAEFRPFEKADRKSTRLNSSHSSISYA